MKRGLLVGAILFADLMICGANALATGAEMYFASDRAGRIRVTNVQEGSSVFIVIHDPDENTDCDVRDKIWTNVKIMDPKTGAYIVWMSLPANESDLGGAATPMSETAGWYYWTQGEDAGLWSSGKLPWKGHWPGDTAGSLLFDYLEETGADTGLFVSKRAFQIGTRVDYGSARFGTHVVDNSFDPNLGAYPTQFAGGNFFYRSDFMVPIGSRTLHLKEGSGYFLTALDYGVFPSILHQDQYQWRKDCSYNPWEWWPASPADGGACHMRGRFENMNTLLGMYQDPNDPTDVAVSMMKIIDTEAEISWDRGIYRDANEAATITVVDPDENLNCSEVEWVPVFVIVNPGSWPPLQIANEPLANTFCGLKGSGGILPHTAAGGIPAAPRFRPIRWYDIYFSGLEAPGLDNYQEDVDGSFYVQYPRRHNIIVYDIGVYFDTEDPTGVCRVMFYAQETSADSGVFQLSLNSLLLDLGFASLNASDVLVAYYLDPNDEDDFKLATAYIGERRHSVTRFTDAVGQEQDIYWIGRDPIHVQVVDANANTDPCCPEQVVVHICDVHGEDDVEWIPLDEMSSNSPIFISHAGMELAAVWNGLRRGILPAAPFDVVSGFQLQIDNWRFEAFNEDDVYVRYNDVYYTADADGLLGLGDSDSWTAMPPKIERFRVANDVSFDVMSIADTQVYDGEQTQMWFLDRNGNRVTGYVNSDCVFVEVLDMDQDEDQHRRERIDGYWDGGQNAPIGPQARNQFECDGAYVKKHPVNHLLGDTNVFNDGEWAKLYVLNPRSGRWAAVDLLETGVSTGDFISVTCIDLASMYDDCVPTLDVLPGDTIVAFYQDPSNHSDSAMISIKVGIGGSGAPSGQASTTQFVDEEGNEVSGYTDADQIYVKVIDPSHSGAAILENAVEIDGLAFSLASLQDAPGTFMTAALEMPLSAGVAITATYTDPTNPADSSSDTITVIANELAVERFYAAPSPFDDECSFGFEGSGVARLMSVTLYDLSGRKVWSSERTNVSEIVWNGVDTSGLTLANGGYIYVIIVTDGTNTFGDKGTVFVNRVDR